eukprot:SM000241S08528  [mRNA]  locus=s241:108591:114170:- [translate_table: standard]
MAQEGRQGSRAAAAALATLRAEDLVAAGLAISDAEAFALYWPVFCCDGRVSVLPLALPQLTAEAPRRRRRLRKEAGDGDGMQAAAWQSAARELLRPEQPWAVHRLLYDTAFAGWDVDIGPPPVWTPSLAEARATNIGRLLNIREGKELEDAAAEFAAFQRLSVNQPEVCPVVFQMTQMHMRDGLPFVDPKNLRPDTQHVVYELQVYWPLVLKELAVHFHTVSTQVLDTSANRFVGAWLPGAVLNAASSCLHPGGQRKADGCALVWGSEAGDGEDAPLQRLTLSELRAQARAVAASIQALGLALGAAVAINAPMHQLAVVAYLGIVLAGCAVVSIADSFSAGEVATRLRISNAAAVDVIVRGNKVLPLYSRVVAAIEGAGPEERALQIRAIVIPALEKLAAPLRAGDLSWQDFMELPNDADTSESRYVRAFAPMPCPAEATMNILFSSGTTGAPKAIPWTHLTPLKAAADAWAHHDLKAGDVVAWPTSLGWMMGPWLIVAVLYNGATIALYNGSPVTRGFAKFVRDARVTVLGLVPSLVKAWRSSRCLDGIEWPELRCFSSTGEASNVDDYLWLMSRAQYRCPIIEYCGGTEIGGAFLTGSLLQPQALAAFSTPAMGCRLYILDQSGQPLAEGSVGSGECALWPIMLGSSSKLLNTDHDKVYFRGMPQVQGLTLRRHGDELKRLPGGYFRAQGRVDDTMNLGGIKVSSVEIERICDGAAEDILETAAIGLPPLGGGPEQLLIVTVLKEGSKEDKAALLKAFTTALQRKLNPLFKVQHVAVAPSLPRTATNKIMRRVLRDRHAKAAKDRQSGARPSARL